MIMTISTIISTNIILTNNPITVMTISSMSGMTRLVIIQEKAVAAQGTSRMNMSCLSNPAWFYSSPFTRV